MAALAADFGKSAEDYANHRQGFPKSLMGRLIRLDVGKAGSRVLDLGTGTGLFAFDFAHQGCEVTGLDPSEPLLAKARQSAEQRGLNVTFVSGVAENTGLPSAAFDVVTAATCWHWFEKTTAAREVRRVLKPGGALVIAVLEWHFLPGNVLTRTLELIRRMAPSMSRANPSTLLYPAWTEELVAAGFKTWEMFAYIEPISYSHAGWRGRVRASQGVGPVMDPATLQTFDTAMARMLACDFPEDPMEVPHRISALVAR